MKIRLIKSIEIAAFSLLSIWILCSFLVPLVGGANSEFNFYVEPILPESQVEGTSGYFNLNLDVEERENLGLILSNPADYSVDVQITTHTAYTNVNGVVEYGRDAMEPDSTLVYSLADLIQSPDVITLGPGEIQEISIPLTMPAERFEGLLAGGLRIEEVRDEEEQEAEEGVAIRNAFSYVIAVIVSNERTTITPELDLLDVFADQLNFRNVFSATIQNFTPRFVNQLEVEAEIRVAGQDEVLYEAHTTGMQMAPNSHFHYPISLNGDRFQNGDYVLNMTARSGDHEWSWEIEFTVDRGTARELNNRDVTLDNSINWWMIGTIGLGVLLLIIIGYLMYKQQQLKKQNNSDES